MTEGQLLLEAISFILMSLKNISKEGKAVGLDAFIALFVEVA